jgi:hypothetical protein
MAVGTIALGWPMSPPENDRRWKPDQLLVAAGCRATAAKSLRQDMPRNLGRHGTWEGTALGKARHLEIFEVSGKPFAMKLKHRHATRRSLRALESMWPAVRLRCTNTATYDSLS